MSAAADHVVVTTRSRLRGLRFFPAMLLATLRVRRQLARAPGVVRWASMIASPLEFWTITVWRSRHDMQEFMRSGAHGEVMWRFARWLRSFWLARWRAGEHERGSWAGLRLARVPAATHGAPARGPIEWPAFLAVAADASGRIGYDSAPLVRRSRLQLEGICATVVRVRAPLWRLPDAFLALGRLRRSLAADEAVVRTVLAVASCHELYLLALWGDRAAAARAVVGPDSQALAERFGEGFWALDWEPEAEFGHWDGMRLRRESRRFRRHATVA